MTELDAVYRFEVPGLAISRYLPGNIIHAPEGTWMMFPPDPPGQAARDLKFTADAIKEELVIAFDSGTTVIQELLIGIQVTENLDLSGTFTDWEQRFEKEQILAILDGSQAAAEEIYINFVDHCRSQLLRGGMYDCGPIWNRRPSMRQLVERGSNRRLPHMQSILFRRASPAKEDWALSEDAAVGNFLRAAYGHRPSMDKLFYADALQATDLRHAVVLAAVACEGAIKRTLLRHATIEQAGLIALMLNNPRDYSQSAVSLFNEPARLVLGQSLRDFDDGLRKRVDKMFQYRNAIVHKSPDKLPTDQQLSDAVEAAGLALNWLDTFNNNAPQPTIGA